MYIVFRDFTYDGTNRVNKTTAVLKYKLEKFSESHVWEKWIIFDLIKEMESIRL